MEKMVDLKERLERLYESYNSKVEQGEDYTVPLIQIASEFNILLEKDRITDYYIKDLKYVVGHIVLELVDTLKEKTYCYKYGPSTYFNTPVEEQEVVYLDFKISSPKKTIGGLYNLATKKFVVRNKKLSSTISYNDYEIVLERGDSLTPDCNSVDELFLIKYYLNETTSDNKTKKRLLFNREISNHKLLSDSWRYESELVFDSRRADEISNTYKKNTTYNKEGIVYKVDDLTRIDVNGHLQGYFFESNDLTCRVVLGNNIQGLPILSYEHTKSAILLKVVTGDEIYHTIQIHKLNEYIFMQCDIYNKITTTKGYKYKNVGTVKQYVKNLSDGKITSDEINSIIEVLPSLSNNSDLITLVSDELKIFADKLNVKYKVVEEEMDPLSPKLLLQKPFREVVNLISNNKKEYFGFAEEYFKKVANVSKVGEEEAFSYRLSKTKPLY